MIKSLISLWCLFQIITLSSAYALGGRNWVKEAENQRDLVREEMIAAERTLLDAQSKLHCAIERKNRNLRVRHEKIQILEEKLIGSADAKVRYFRRKFKSIKKLQGLTSIFLVNILLKILKRFFIRAIFVLPVFSFSKEHFKSGPHKIFFEGVLI